MTGTNQRGPNTTRVDERVRPFGPYGLMTDGALTNESAIAFNASRLDAIVISDTAPEAVREHLAALCELHRHGAFEYRFFALRNALAHRTTPFITTPVESARAIASYASLVNALWPPSVASDPGRQDGPR